MGGVRQALLYAGLATGVFGLALWLQQLRLDMAFTPPAETPHVASMRMEGVTLQVFGEDGLPSYRILAPTMTRFADDDTMELAAPLMQVFNPGQAAMTVRSERAWLASDRNEVQLLGEARITQPDSVERSGYTVYTSDVHVFPQRREGLTDQPVLTVGEGYRIEGMGGDIDMDRGIVNLHRDVRSTYLANPLADPRADGPEP